MSALSGCKTTFFRRLGPSAALVFGLLASSPAWGADPEFALTCPDLGSEPAAEVEARARATLLTTTLEVTRLEVSCSGARATVVVRAGALEATEHADLVGTDSKGALVDAVDRAIQELARLQANAASEPPLADSPPSEPPAEPVTAAQKTPPKAVVAPPSSGSARSEAQPSGSLVISALALGELWQQSAAAGGALGVAWQWHTLSLGVVLVAATALPRPSTFWANEYSGTLTLTWTPTWAHGFRGRVGLGPSLLDIIPRADIEAQGSTRVGAWFAELGIARPFASGHWAFVPELGARVFSAERFTNLDGNPELVLPYFVPRLAFGLAYVVN